MAESFEPSYPGISSSDAWKRLQLFSHLLGANFNQENEEKLVSAFQDFVYFMNFGWNDPVAIDDAENEETGSFSFHESSLDCDGNEILVEDVLDIAHKLNKRARTSDDDDNETDPPNRALEASPMFLHNELSEEWIHKFVGMGCLEMASTEFKSRHVSIFRLPGMCPDPEYEPSTDILNESLISIAMRAGCFSLHRDCYDVLRKVATEYVEVVLKAAFGSLQESPRANLIADDVREAIYSTQGRMICGYGFKGVKRAFYHEIMKALRQVHPNTGIEFTALAILSDILCELLDRLVVACSRTAPVGFLPARSISLDRNNRDTSTSSCEASADTAMIVVANSALAAVTTAPVSTSNLITLDNARAALGKCITRELYKHSLNESNKAVSKYKRSDGDWDRGLGNLSGLVFMAEHVALLAKEWHDVTFSDDAVIFVTAVVEYICAEIAELGGNSARDNGRTAISGRDILLAIAKDEELAFLFKECVYRDGGTFEGNDTVISASKAWTAAANQAFAEDTHLQEEEEEAEDEDGYERQGTFHDELFKFIRWDRVPENCTVDDALTGFPMKAFSEYSVRLPLRIDQVTAATSEMTRKQRRDKIVSIYRSDKTLTRGLPVDASPESLDCLDFVKLGKTFETLCQTVATNTFPDIHRAPLKHIIATLCADSTFTGNKDWKFTHEAVNVLHLGLEHYLFELLRDACGKVLASGLTIVETSHIQNAKQSAALVTAARTNNRELISQLLAADVVNVNSMFMFQSAIMAACDNDDDALMQWLIERGADVNLWHQTPIFECRGSTNVLMRAIQCGKIKVLQLLLHGMCDFVDFAVRNHEGQDALMLFVQAIHWDDHTDLVETLVTRSGVNINATDNVGRTALHLACEKGRINAAEKLIFLGADTDMKWEKRKFLKLLPDGPDVAINRARLTAAIELVATPGLK